MVVFFAEGGDGGEDGGFQTVERVIRVRVAAFVPRASDHRGYVLTIVVGVNGNIPLCVH